MVHPGGRPPEWDREQLFLALLDWAELPDSLLIIAFCTSYLKHVYGRTIAPSQLLRYSNETEEFRLAYETAKAYVGARREEANAEKIISDKAYHSNLRVYDHVNYMQWKEEKAYEASLKLTEDRMKEEDKAAMNVKFDEVINQLQSMSSSHLKSDDNNISNDTKS